MSEQAQTAARVLLFLGLAWLIFIVTPRLFLGRPIVPVQQGTEAADSAQRATPGAEGGVPLPAVSAPTQVGGVARAPGLTVPDTGGAVSVEGEARPAAVRTVVSDSLAAFTLNSVGARIGQVQLLGFRKLSGEDGPVALLRPEEALLRFHVVSGRETISLVNASFEVDSSEAMSSSAGGVRAVRYTAPVPGTEMVLSVRYEFEPNSYMVRVSGELRGAPQGTLLVLEMPTGMESGEANLMDDLNNFGVAFKRERGDVQGVPFRKLKPGEDRPENLVPVTWVAVKSKYFVIGLLKAEGEPGFLEVRMIGGVRATSSATHVRTFVTDDLSSGRFSYELYAGPQEFKRMVAVGRDFQNSNPYGGWLQPVVQPFAVLVMRALLWLKGATNLNYGWVLIIFGVIVRLALWPLNQKAMRSSLRMQQLQPELTEIQAKYKGNPQKQQEEIMRVYRDHGMTPLSPLAGCLPMLIPMPVFFALFFVFQSTIEFRGVPFLWLPDISLKDPLYIIPVFMGLSMYVMSWVGSRNAPQTPQTKMLMYGLPVMLTVLFMNFASGLNLYYAVQNVAALPQQWLLSRERMRSTPQKGGEKKAGSEKQAVADATPNRSKQKGKE